MKTVGLSELDMLTPSRFFHTTLASNFGSIMHLIETNDMITFIFKMNYKSNINNILLTNQYHNLKIIQ